MPAPEVRPFRKTDRDQLTDLVNLHVAAVVPGVSVSVNTVLGDLERRLGEFITDPWVAERTTLVAEQRGHVLAAAHLLRYRADAEVGADTGTPPGSTGSSTARRRHSGRTPASPRTC